MGKTQGTGDHTLPLRTWTSWGEPCAFSPTKLGARPTTYTTYTGGTDV